MPEAEAHIQSEKAERYLAQLCKHFAHKVEAEWQNGQGHVDFGFGTCALKAADGFLRVACKADTDDHLRRVKYILEDHIVRFGWRESLSVEWSRDDAPGSYEPPAKP